MFSLVGEGDRGFSGAEVGGAKNGDEAEIPLKAGDSMGGLLDCEAVSGRIHGPDDLFSTAESTGDAACGGLFLSSFFPSA